MEIETLALFAEVARKESFAAVARERGIAGSSVSRAVASLEEELGVRLLQRSTRRVSVTEAGAAFLDVVEPLLSEVERAWSVARDADNTPRGVLRVTAPLTFAQLNLVPLLPEFAERYPNLRFELLLTDSLVDVVAERVDVALRLGHLQDSEMIATRLCDMVYVACASPDYLERHGRPMSPLELEDHSCLRYAVPSFGARWLFRPRPGGDSFEVSIGGRFTISNGVALRDCAVAGLGITLLPRWNVARELAAGDLVDLFPEFEATATRFGGAAWLMYPSRAHVPLKVRAFRDFVQEKFADGAPSEAALRA